MTATQDRTPAYTSTYKKLAVQWLIEALCFVSSSLQADSLVLRKPPHRQAAKTLEVMQNSHSILY